MQFNRCIDMCTYEGTHCEGCARSHKEIAETKKLVMTIVNFIQEKEYNNSEAFMATITKSVLKRVQ